MYLATVATEEPGTIQYTCGMLPMAVNSGLGRSAYCAARITAEMGLTNKSIPRQAQRRSETNLRRIIQKTHTNNGRNSEKGYDPPHDCTIGLESRSNKLTFQSIERQTVDGT